MAPKSLVWRYFETNLTKALCTLCGKCLANLWSHLLSQHPKQYQELHKLSNQDLPQNEANQENLETILTNDVSSLEVYGTSSEQASPSTSSEHASSSTSSQGSTVPNFLNTTKLRQSSLDNKFIKLSKTDNERITNAISYFIAVDGEAYSAPELKGFQHLMKVLAPTYQIPSRTTFSERKVPKLYEETKKVIKNKIRAIHFFGLTSDGWTAPNKHKFFALTYSYIDEDWILNSHTLACRDLNQANTGENIKMLIGNELMEYKIEKEKMSAVTTDRGSNVLLAVKLLGFNSIPCFAHVINTKMDEMLKLGFIAPTLEKVKSIYSALSCSSNAKKYLCTCQAELKLPQNVMPSTCKTRWWSEIDQFKFVVRFEMALYKFVTTYPDINQNLLINANDVSRMKALLLVMKPMQKYVATLGSEKIITASFIPPLIEKLDSIFAKFNFHDTVASFEIRKFFKPIPKFCTDLYLEEKSHIELATYLDPRFKNSARGDLDAIIEMDINEVITSKAVEKSNLLENKVPAKKQRKTALEELFEEDERDVPNDARSEINLFHSQSKIKITDCPLTWWKGRSSMLPNLAIVAKKYLCMPATSVLSERVFSDGRDMIGHKRHRLTDEHAEQLIFLSMNSNIVPKI